MADALWLTEADVVEAVDLVDAIDAVEEALRSEARGDAHTMEKTHLAWGSGHTLHAIGGVDEHEGIVADEDVGAHRTVERRRSSWSGTRTKEPCRRSSRPSRSGSSARAR